MAATERRHDVNLRPSAFGTLVTTPTSADRPGCGSVFEDASNPELDGTIEAALEVLHMLET